MISLENQYGTIEISQEYFANLVGRAASECFGVVGMISSPTQGIRSIMNGGKDVPDKGVHVRTSGGGLIVGSADCRPAYLCDLRDEHIRHR